MSKALIIVDVQNDYFPNGKCELYQAQSALNTVWELLKYFRGKELPVYYIQHISAKDAAFFVPDTQGVNIHEGIKPLDTEKVIIKHPAVAYFFQGAPNFFTGINKAAKTTGRYTPLFP